MEIQVFINTVLRFGYVIWNLTKTLYVFHYRNLVERLARVNPTELSHNEKLAFWINIYNALIMHVIIISLKFPSVLI